VGFEGSTPKSQHKNGSFFLQKSFLCQSPSKPLRRKIEDAGGSSHTLGIFSRVVASNPQPCGDVTRKPLFSFIELLIMVQGVGFESSTQWRYLPQNPFFY
jgi:hypothetical protein